MIRNWLIGTLLAYAAKTTSPLPPARVEPTVKKTPPAVTVSPEMLATLRARFPKPESLYTATAGFKPEVFAPAKPPPGVIPANVRPMAMDDDFGSTWGAWGAGFAGAYSENIQWLGFPYLAELSQRAEYRQIVETLAKEMTRRWIRVSATGDGDKSERVAQVEAALKKHRIREKFRRLAELDGFYGRGHLYVDTGITGDRDLLKTALILDKRLNDKGFLQGFRVIEPTWTYPGMYNSQDPLKEDFYRPHTWYVFGKEVHRTRLIPMISRELPDLLKPSYAFGGLSMSQLARPYIDNWLRTRQSVSDLIHSFSVSGLKTDMSAFLQNQGSELMMQRAEAFSLCRDNMGTMVIDFKTEDFFNVSTPLSTLDHLQAQAQEQLASVSHIPLIVLLGITPSGLNVTAEPELATWAAWVRSSQEHLFDEPLRFVLQAVQLDMWGEIDEDIDFDYEPIRELTDLEEANAEKLRADTAKVWIDAGVLDPAEPRQALAADPDSPYAGIDLSGPPPDPPAPPDTDPLGASGGVPGSDGPIDALGAVAAAIADLHSGAKLDAVAGAIGDRH
jgi:phage-related protein (TIGR01555 family)